MSEFAVVAVIRSLSIFMLTHSSLCLVVVVVTDAALKCTEWSDAIAQTLQRPLTKWQQ